MPVPVPRVIGEADESVTAVVAWLGGLGLGRYADAASESADYCDVEDFHGLLGGADGEFEACCEELGIDRRGGDAAKLRAGVAALAHYE